MWKVSHRQKQNEEGLTPTETKAKKKRELKKTTTPAEQRDDGKRKADKTSNVTATATVPKPTTMAPTVSVELSAGCDNALPG